MKEAIIAISQIFQSHLITFCPSNGGNGIRLNSARKNDIFAAKKNKAIIRN